MTKIQTLEKEVKLLKKIVQSLEKHIDTLMSRPTTIIHYHYPPVIQESQPYIQNPIVWCDGDTGTTQSTDSTQWSYTTS